MTAERQDPRRSSAAAIPVVDAHVHVFAPEVIGDRASYVGKDDWFRALYEDPKSRMVTFERVIEEMDATGVGRSVIFGFAYRDQGLCRMANDYVLEAMRAYPERLVGLACISPEEPGAVKELERCLDAGMRGAGELFPDGQRFDLTEPGPLDEIASVLAERGHILNLHSNEPVGHKYPGKGDNTPGPCFEFARRHPDLDIVYAHMGGGLFMYELMPEVRKVLARVYYDTSAVPYLYRRDVYSIASVIAGPEKVVFGSDYPLLSPARYLQETEDLDDLIKSAIFGGNMANLLA